MGDFNVNLMNFNEHSLTGEFLDGMYSNLLCPLINRPTRITSHSATLIDNILTNNIGCHSIHGLLFKDVCDHLPIFSILFEDQSNSSIDHETYFFHDKSKENFEKFKERVTICDWSSISNNTEPTEAYCKFSTEFINIYNECFPLKKNTKKRKICKPWISQGLLKSIKKKNKLYKKYLRNPNSISETTYKNYKNKLSHSIRIAKRLYLDRKFTENKSNIKQTWKILNNIMNKRKHKSLSNTVFNCGNREVSDPLETANGFCQYFSNIGPNLDKHIPASSISPKMYLSGEFVNSIFLDPVTENEVIKVVKNKEFPIW